MTDRPFDIVLFGATGFTGRQAARTLAEHAPAGLRVALAGRRRGALEELAGETKAAGIVLADSSDVASIEAMVAQARVVATTAGPFARYGSDVVAACAASGVHYADITGETPWVRGMIAAHHGEAAASGARLIPFCGVDSVPADLGTLYAVTEVRRRFGDGTRRVSGSYAMRGGLNGGTLASALAMQDPASQAAFADVLLLNPEGQRSAAERAQSADRRGVSFDPQRGVWLGPYMMAPIDTRVVRRSRALAAEAGEPYGAYFAYDEAFEFKSRLVAELVTRGMGVGERVLSTRLGAALARRFGPAPGEGPSEETMQSGFLRLRLVAESERGRRLLVTFAMDGDPGNRVTVACLAQAAIALAEGVVPAGPGREGGILTPAFGLGLPLLERLQGVGLRLGCEEIA